MRMTSIVDAVETLKRRRHFYQMHELLLLAELLYCLTTISSQYHML
jgi:hypothetical protein